MIFVTVGTTPFDALIEEMDILAPELKDKVVCQIASGTYIPKNCGYFRMEPDISDRLKKADVVVTHGGAATIFEAMAMGKKVIAVCNPDMKEKHQEDLVKHLAAKGCILEGGMGILKKALRSRKKPRPLSPAEFDIGAVQELLSSPRSP